MHQQRSPYYVMGYAAFASHDYPAASMMFDAAVAEDLRLPGGSADTPALRFMRLEDRGQEVLASQIVRDIIQSAEELIRIYNARADARAITASPQQRPARTKNSPLQGFSADC